MPLIDKSIIRRVERELYSYPQHLQANAERREELLYGTPTMEGERTCNTNKTGNPTMQRGVGLAELSEGEHGKWLNMINFALTHMPREHQLLIKFKYFDGLNNDMVAEKLYVSRKLFYIWKDSVINSLYMLAMERGLMPTKGREVS